jgi:hypothetical protein
MEYRPNLQPLPFKGRAGWINCLERKIKTLILAFINPVPLLAG